MVGPAGAAMLGSVAPARAAASAGNSASSYSYQSPVAQTASVSSLVLQAMSSSSKGAGITAAAMGQVGVSQDCTSAVSNALGAVGINFRSWPADYFSLGTQASAAQAQPGDLIYYADGGVGFAHIGVYIGGGKVVHGGWNGNQTVVDSVNVGSGRVYIRVS